MVGAVVGVVEVYMFCLPSGWIESGYRVDGGLGVQYPRCKTKYHHMKYAAATRATGKTYYYNLTIQYQRQKWLRGSVLHSS
jgi:hypothetical protein